MKSRPGTDGILHELTVEEAIHAVGLEMLMLTEELKYATGTLNEEECSELGDRVYLLTQVLGSVLIQHKKNLTRIRVVLPSDVGSVRIRNPYYEGRSESPEDKSSGQSDGIGGVESSIDDFPF